MKVLEISGGLSMKETCKRRNVAGLLGSQRAQWLRARMKSEPCTGRKGGQGWPGVLSHEYKAGEGDREGL